MPRESSKNRSAKTNKTSHVLSLLTNDGEPTEELTPPSETEAVETEPPAPEPEKAAAPKREKPASEGRRTTSRTRKKKPAPAGEEAIASEIRTALEDALKAEEAAELESRTAEDEPPVRENAPEPPSVPEEASAPAEPERYDFPSFDPEAPVRSSWPFEPEAPEPAESVRPEPFSTDPEPVETVPPAPPVTDPEPVEAAPTAPEPVPAEPAPSAAAQQPAAPESKPRPAVELDVSTDEEPFCFNVMEALVESKAEKYIDLFGLCPCSRCRTDVVALALTRLPAKYVVATRADLVPLLSVYEGRYNAAVVSQVMRACNRVSEQPRHKKP